MIKRRCPACRRKVDFSVVEAKHRVTVRGEEFDVQGPVLQCSNCAAQIEYIASGYDYLSEGNNAFKRKHGLLLPSEIKSFRESLGLNQRDFSQLLGFGEGTIHRYENGSIQDEAHDNTMRLAMLSGDAIDILLSKKPELRLKINSKDTNYIQSTQWIKVKNKAIIEQPRKEGYAHLSVVPMYGT